MESKNLSTIPARIKVSDTEIDISGSESFVSEQITKLGNIFQLFGERIKLNTALSLTEPKHPPLLGLNNPPESADYSEYEVINSQSSKERFENIVAFNGSDFQVLIDIPGDTLRQKMTNLILIYMFFKANENKTSISFSELRGICEKHAVIDKKNFSRIMHDQKKLFIINSDNKSLHATLTIPGKREALKLLETLNKLIKD